MDVATKADLDSNVEKFNELRKSNYSQLNTLRFSDTHLLAIVAFAKTSNGLAGDKPTNS